MLNNWINFLPSLAPTAPVQLDGSRHPEWPSTNERHSLSLCQFIWDFKMKNYATFPIIVSLGDIAFVIDFSLRHHTHFIIQGASTTSTLLFTEESDWVASLRFQTKRSIWIECLNLDRLYFYDGDVIQGGRGGQTGLRNENGTGNVDNCG